MAMSRTAWAVTAVAVATTAGGPDGSIRADVGPDRDAGPGDGPTDIPYIDVTTCDA
ncbi:hypothetical protein RDE2_14590 [Rhodococcus sp. RDE2]|nr:hypothetical protein RDE2_14590 [Rhodococcus sp. RDE2]